ncbi:TetR/AcrR family transcriptional regulator [Paenibacillus aestuarii]|uniref:TetR/AcrR family transcriptional regulator n=1 Tax=Paenibacillus aestuarii TaxID=516965 RepID=A0ABW0K530_9BACL|nr:TetR/AcrR family transcriptional regulator [Paenibacillus aestuarii]
MAPRNSINLQAILQAATEIVDASGVEALTLTSLAQKLDIRSPSLYNHFNGLSGIRKLLSVYGLEQLQYALTRSAIGRAGDQAIREMAKAYVNFARKHPGLYEVTLLANGPQDEEVSKVGQEIVDLVTQVLKAYQLVDEDAIHMARAFRSILHGFASLEQKGGFGLPVDLDVSLEKIIDTFLAGLHARYPNIARS